MRPSDWGITAILIEKNNMNKQYKLETALNPLGWLVAYDLINKGKAITKDQLPGFVDSDAVVALIRIDISVL